MVGGQEPGQIPVLKADHLYARRGAVNFVTRFVSSRKNKVKDDTVEGMLSAGSLGIGMKTRTIWWVRSKGTATACGCAGCARRPRLNANWAMKRRGEMTNWMYEQLRRRKR